MAPFIENLKNERGSIIIALPLTFFLFLAMVWIVRTTQDVTSADVVLRSTMEIAVKAAANQYRQGSGEIDTASARDAFEQLLRENLKMDNNLQALSNSMFSGRPAYKLLVYNGNRGYDYRASF
ncbi:MAG: hypothetical protein M1609_03345, partial [Firmicutes bacterium]|nr:hypothetical protein [Bacillota bacterium]